MRHICLKMLLWSRFMWSLCPANEEKIKQIKFCKGCLTQGVSEHQGQK